MAETRDMPAGRELDAEITQAIWGVGIHWSTHPCYDGEPTMLDPHDDPRDGPTECPHFSTDANDALGTLVPEMEGFGYTMRLDRHNGKYRVWFDRGTNVLGKTGAAEKLPLAICRAALAAVGGEP